MPRIASCCQYSDQLASRNGNRDAGRGPSAATPTTRALCTTPHEQHSPTHALH
jgi:hypothetical protein